MKKILLIEDDHFLGKLYLDILSQNKDYQVYLTSDGQLAYEAIVKDHFDLILLDSLLPKMNAVDILNKLKAEHPDKLKEKIIIITNVDEGQVLNRLKQYKLDILMKSQMTPDIFIDKIKSYLNG